MWDKEGVGRPPLMVVLVLGKGVFLRYRLELRRKLGAPRLSGVWYRGDSPEVTGKQRHQDCRTAVERDPVQGETSSEKNAPRRERA